MATTRTVTGHTIDGVRTNDDGSTVLLITVTYDDASTDKVELDVVRLVP